VDDSFKPTPFLASTGIYCFKASVLVSSVMSVLIVNGVVRCPLVL
jgi:hypothetical protein